MKQKSLQEITSQTYDEVELLFKQRETSAYSRFEKKILLENAKEKGNLFLMYQPKVSIKEKNKGEVLALEALVRWEFKPGKFISPFDFMINFCEKESMVVSIGDYIIERVFLDMKQWKEEITSLVSCSINVTKEQLHPNLRLLSYDDNYCCFAETMKNFARKYAISKDLIEFEVIERNTFCPETRDEKITFDSIVPILKKLKQDNFKLSIDDYDENGFHNIGTLRSRLFDYLKIDKKDIDNISSCIEILNDFLHYRENYNLPLIAEGVETKDQLDFLRKYQWHGQKVDMVQGYYFSKPIYANNIPQILTPGYFKDKF